MNAKMDWFKNKDLTAEAILFGILAAGFFSMPLGTAPPTGLSIAAAAVWLFSGTAFRFREIYLKQSWCRPVWALMVLPWVCLIYSPDPAGIGLEYAGKTHYWIYAMAMAAVAARADRERLVQAFLAGLAANAVVGGMQLAGLYPPTNGWYCGFGRGYSTLSAYLVLGMLMASYYFRTLTDRRFKAAFPLPRGVLFFPLGHIAGAHGICHGRGAPAAHPPEHPPPGPSGPGSPPSASFWRA